MAIMSASMALPVGSVPASERWPRQAVLVAIAGGSLSVGLTGLSVWRARQAVHDEFAADSVSLIDAANERMETAAAVARALRSKWLDRDAPTAGDFAGAAGAALASAPHVEALLWCDRVALGEREAWAQRASATAGHDVVVRNLDGAAPRATYSWPIAFVHPPSPGASPLGLDVGALFADGAALDALARSVGDAPQSTVTKWGDAPTCVLLAYSVPSRADATVPSNTRSLVAAVVNIDELAASASAPSWARGLSLAIGPASPGASGATLERSGALALGPAGWSVRVRATADFAAGRDKYTPWALLALGLALTALLTQRLRALELRTRALSHANAELYSEIGERHTAETRLRETQRALATLVANLPGVAYRCANAPDWPMEFISDGCAALTGHPARDFIDGNVSFGKDLIHPDDRAYVWNGVQQAIDSHRPFQLVYRIVTSAGQIKWVWEQGRGVYSRADELLALEGLINDITERKLAEEGFKREMRFVEAIIDSLPGNFYVFDESGRFLRWNQNVERVTGFSPLELAAMGPNDFFDGEDRERVERAVRQVFEEGRTIVDARLKTKSGPSIPFHFTGVLFSHDGARYLVGVGIDVSEREQALAEQARVREQLLHTSKLEGLGVMASGIAHDFNNMLTVVLANASMAQSAVEPGSEAHNLLEQTLNATQNASEITRQLLSLARGDSHARGPVALSDLVRSLEKLLRSSIKRRVQVEYQLAPDLPPVQADAAQLRQLALNLALNAGEACLERGGTVVIATGERSLEAADLTPRAFRGTKSTGRHVFLEVRDDGSGMDAATLARLGEPFFTTRVAGRGLGMAAVLGILAIHGGWLELESTPGSGTTVRACLPAP